MIRPSSTAQEKVPFSHTSAQNRETIEEKRKRGKEEERKKETKGGKRRKKEEETKGRKKGASLESDGRTCAEAATAGNASGSAVRSDRLMRQQTTIDAERAARTPVNPAQDARINLVDLRVGNKPETFAGDTHEWKGWSFKMRQYIAVVDGELYRELVNVEANPLREMPLAGMNEPQKRRARQLAFMLTMHTKDRALQTITKLSDPANGFEIWRRSWKNGSRYTEDGTGRC